MRSWLIKYEGETSKEEEGKMTTIFLKDGNDKKAEKAEKQFKKKMKQLELNLKLHIQTK